MDFRLAYAGDKIWRHYNKMNLLEFNEDTLEAEHSEELLTERKRLENRPEHGVRES